MTVAIYIRVSTREQAVEGYSIPAQKARLKAYCKAQGWDEYRFYVDAGISAKDMEREQLQLMLEHVRQKKIKMILVFRLDRFTRSVRDLYEMLDMLDKHECAFKSATELYDTSSAMGRMFIGLVALLAQWERENIGERVVVALDERADDLKAIGKAPYGFIIQGDYYVMTNDTEEANTVRWLIENVLNGLSVNGMARHLNRRQTLTPRKKGIWYASTVKRILSNPALYGAYFYKGKLTENAFEGYIDKETFNTIQEKMKIRSTEYIRGVSEDAIFQGVLTCPMCSHTLSPAVYYSKVSKEKLGYTYKCRSCRDKKEYHKSYNEKKLMDAVLKYMKGVVLDPTPPTEEDHSTEFKELKSQIEKVEKQRLKYQRAWASDFINDDEFTKLMQETSITLKEINDQVQKIPNEDRKVDYERIKDFAWTFNESFQNLSTIEQRTFISRFVKRIKFKVESEVVVNRKRPRDLFHVTDIEFYL